MSSFDASKASILENLDAGLDFSFKGSIDAPILELVNFINSHTNYYTTSSCSGRVSIFRSGNSAKHIKWLLVKHRTFTTEEFLQSISQQDEDPIFIDSLVTLKCEPFILHINCRDIDSARLLHDIVTLCGFRESGIKLGNKKVILAVRTTANCMELPLAKGSNLIVSNSYLDLIVNECNHRLLSNFTRIDKFLLELKKQYKFPTIQLLPSYNTTANSSNDNTTTNDSLNNQIQRWGHTICSTINTNRKTNNSYILGGYGNNKCEKMENKHTAEHSQRGLDSFLHTGERINKIAINDDSMHAASAIVTLQATTTSTATTSNTNTTTSTATTTTSAAATTSDITTTATIPTTTDTTSDTTTTTATATTAIQLLLLSGGRLSPSTPLGCIRLYNIQSAADYQPISYITQGDQPSPRWGHTITLIRQNQTCSSYLFYGGRDSTMIYNDMYILHISLSPSTIEMGLNNILCICKWEKLIINQIDCILPGRFFHATCMTPLIFPADDSQNNEYNLVIIHGGVLSINDPIACGKGYVFDPNTSTVTPLFPSCITTNTTNDNNINDLATSTATTIAAVVDNKVGYSSCNREISRFGHTITSIGAKTMLLLGGSSFQDNTIGSTSNQGYVLDIYIDTMGSYRGSLRTLDVRLNDHIEHLPCQACRTHHQVIYDPVRCILEVIGGGALTLAFGAHYCPAWKAHVTFIGGHHNNISYNNNLSHTTNTTTSASSTSTPQLQLQHTIQEKTTNKNSKYNTSFLSNFKNSMKITTSIPVLFIPASAVRTLKVSLEEKGLLQKKQSITKIEEDIFIQCNTEENAHVLQYISMGKSNSSRVISITEALTVLNTTTSSTSTDTSGSIDSSSSSSIPMSIMAVPIVESLATDLHSLLASSSAPPLPPLSSQQETVLTLLQEIAEATSLTELLVGMYTTRSSKRTQVNSAQKANELLLALSAQHHLPVISTTTTTNNNTTSTTTTTTTTDSSSLLLSSRFEVVGDVLMLPENYLSGPQWNNILGIEFDTAGNPTSTTITSIIQYRNEVFSTLAQCFGLKRIARKAEIDSGPKRESKVRLLYPVVGISNQTGPGTEGWVTVYENKIGFSFDITRVMFCSGNVTERMRMGRQSSSKGNIVVDLYSGIGYYTIPLLLHGQAEHVYACEWNPNSVLALRNNLQQLGLLQKCTIYEGDNQITSRNLINIADRISLGLLPSSVAGWPLAVRALKKTGGIIHIHENVHEKILKIWIQETIEKFSKMFEDHNKPMSITEIHLEKVKSYAPRVYHVVLDLLCIEKL